MNKSEETISVFFALLRAGLWEQEVRLLPFGPIDFESVYSLADEQSVAGLVGAGLEHVQDMKITKPQALPFLKKVFSLEGQNQAMNSFIATFVDKLQAAGIDTVLLKGQGVAQCYDRPLWRGPGDVDLLVRRDDYGKAKAFMEPLASEGVKENEVVLEYATTIDSTAVELHGSLRCWLSDRMDDYLDGIQDLICIDGEVRPWQNGNRVISLPSADNDIIVIFTHFVKHFFRGGIGLRQLCDWCRLLWTYREQIDRPRLEERLRKLGLVTEWKSFAYFAVDRLGMPAEAMPFYEPKPRWKRNARRINTDILREGNFGQNRDLSYYSEYPYFIYKTISLWHHFRDALRHSLIFPIDSWRVFSKVFSRGVDFAMQGK